MNQQWLYSGVQSYDSGVQSYDSGVQSYAAPQQLMMSNYYTSPQWSPVQPSMSSTMSSPVMYPQMYSVPGPQFSPVYYPSNQCYPNNQNMSSSSCEAAGGMGQVWPPVHHPPNSRISMIRADNMSVEQTAEWVRTLGRYKSWEEADEYAKSFLDNNIWGYLLQKLTNKTLKEDLGIAKCGHRLEMMLAIKALFPERTPSKQIEVKNMLGNNVHQSPMAESAGEGRSDTASSDRTKSPAPSSMVYSESKEDVEAMEHSISKKFTPVVNPSSCKDPTSKSRWNRWNRERARPSHPLIYKTLRRSKLRSGKGGLAKVLGYLPRGSIVVINQIKGRSGRVVFQDELGKYKTAGWVTLYTEDNQQLMRKHNPQMKDGGTVLSSLRDVMVE